MQRASICITPTIRVFVLPLQEIIVAIITGIIDMEIPHINWFHVPRYNASGQIAQLVLYFGDARTRRNI